MIVTPNVSTGSTPRQNREAILRALAGGGVSLLPPGLTWIDEQLWLGPEYSGCTLIGSGTYSSILKPVGQAPSAPHTLVLWGSPFFDPGPSGQTVAEGALLLKEVTQPLNGDWSYITGGKMIYDTLSGEWRRASGGPGKATTLDRPLRRAYEDVRICTGRPVVGVTLSNFTIAQPWLSGAYCLLARRAVNLTLDRVCIGQSGDPQSGWGAAESGGLKFLDVDSSSHPLGLNTTRDVLIRGGRYMAIIGEADCADCDLSDALIATAGQPWQSLQWYLGSDRFRCRNVRVEGGGSVNPGGGTFPPLSVWGRECRLENVEVVYSQSPPGYGCAFGGDKFVADGLKTDLLTAVTEGHDIRLLGCVAPNWWLFPNTSGSADRCQGIPDVPDWDADGTKEVQFSPAPVVALAKPTTGRLVVNWKSTESPMGVSS